MAAAGVLDGRTLRSEPPCIGGGGNGHEHRGLRGRGDCLRVGWAMTRIRACAPRHRYCSCRQMSNTYTFTLCGVGFATPDISII